MILPIIEYPNKILKTVSSKVTTFDEDLHRLLDNMYDTMLAKNGIGLAAIQVAKPIRALIINLPNEEDNTQNRDDLIEIINPVIEHQEGNTTYQEGCLSVPGFYEDIDRFDTIGISYQDRNGTKQTLEASDLLSIAIQHEIDHLDGKLFIEKLSFLKRKKFEKELKKKLRERKSNL